MRDAFARGVGSRAHRIIATVPNRNGTAACLKRYFRNEEPEPAVR
jgi:hypothetical protein